MNQRFTAFLTTAQTLSIAKAAEQNFVSYQCISGHIRSLEEEYRVKLFERRPKFALTADGRTLLEALQKIKLLEDGIAQSFADQGQAVTGHVTLGLPPSRYIEIVPPVLSQFHCAYPHVELEIVQDYSNALQQQVERGMLDMAVVVQQARQANPRISAQVLLREAFLFLVSYPLLQQCLGEDWRAAHDHYRQQGITLAEMAKFPLAAYPAGSRVGLLLDAACTKQGVALNTIFASNRAEVFDAIARTNIAGGIISHQLYGITVRNNCRLKAGERLQAYRINWGDYTVDRAMMLIHNPNSVLAPYKQHLMRIVHDHFAGYDDLSKDLLPRPGKNTTPQKTAPPTA